jgi:hypothetical protein
MIQVFLNSESIAKKALRYNGSIVDFGWNEAKTAPNPSATHREIRDRFSSGEDIHENAYPNDAFPTVGPQTPEEARNFRITQIEINSEVLLSAGVAYDSVLFSLSSAAQSNWIALQVAVLSSGVTYPYDVSTIYGTTYTVQDSGHMTAFLSAVFSRINAVKGPNGAVRLRNTVMSIYFDSQLTDAQKIVNIMAVVDDRV